MEDTLFYCINSPVCFIHMLRYSFNYLFMSGCDYSSGHARSFWQREHCSRLCHRVCAKHNGQLCSDIQFITKYTRGWLTTSAGKGKVGNLFGIYIQGASLRIACSDFLKTKGAIWFLQKGCNRRSQLSICEDGRYDASIADTLKVRYSVVYPNSITLLVFE